MSKEYSVKDLINHVGQYTDSEDFRFVMVKDHNGKAVAKKKVLKRPRPLRLIVRVISAFRSGVRGFLNKVAVVEPVDAIIVIRKNRVVEYHGLDVDKLSSLQKHDIIFAVNQILDKVTGKSGGRRRSSIIMSNPCAEIEVRDQNPCRLGEDLIEEKRRDLG